MLFYFVPPSVLARCASAEQEVVCAEFDCKTKVVIKNGVVVSFWNGQEFTMRCFCGFAHSLTCMNPANMERA
jgi:hypothetical protein